MLNGLHAVKSIVPVPSLYELSTMLRCVLVMWLQYI